MTALLFSQVVPDTSVSVNSNTQEIQNTVAATSPVTVEELQLAADVLQLMELQHNSNANIFIRQTISEQYKKVSEDLDPANKKRKLRKKTLKDMMKQSFFHGAYWLGSNFIA